MNAQNTKPANQGNITQKKNAKLDSKSAPPLSFFGKKASGVFCLGVFIVKCVYRKKVLRQGLILVTSTSYFIMEFSK